MDSERTQTNGNPEQAATARRARERFAAAVIDRDTGQMRRIQRTERPAPMALSALKEAMEGLGMFTKDGHQDLTEHVRLSPQTPWVDGKGWLEAINPRSLYTGNSPNMGFVPEQGQPQGRLDIWLDGLDPDATYIAQVEVGSIGNGVFQVRAVTLSGGVNDANTEANGGFQTLINMFGTGAEGGLGMIRVSNPDWSFYEVVVSKLA